MKSFKYSFPAKIILKYGYAPLSLVLIIYIIFSVAAVFQSWNYIFPLLINILFFYIVIRFYLKLKKYFPFKIEIDSEKLVFSDFLVKKEPVVIKFDEIEDITGGIFSGNAARPIYIISNNKNIQIGIYRHVKEFNELLKLILSNVKQDVYNSLLKKMEDIASDYKKKRNKKAP